MTALICLLLKLGASLFKPKSRLEAENAALRHQLAVLQRKVRGRVRFTNSDRLYFIQLYRWFPSVLKAITIIRPEMHIRCCKSRCISSTARGGVLGTRHAPVSRALHRCAGLRRLYVLGSSQRYSSAITVTVKATTTATSNIIRVTANDSIATA
jgi:hypothetical protein